MRGPSYDRGAMTSVLDSLLGGAALSEGFTDAAHPRGFHGRWIRTGDHHELKVFHGSEHLGNVPADDRTRMMIGASNVVGRAGKTITTKDVGSLVDRALGEFGSEGPRRPENLGAQRRDAANVHLRQANPLGRTATRVAGGQRVASGAAARQAEVAQSSGSHRTPPPNSRRGLGSRASLRSSVSRRCVLALRMRRATRCTW